MRCLLAAALLLIAVDARGQYFTPAPVDLTGRVPAASPNALPGEIAAAINQHGELFVWNPLLGHSLTRLRVSCEVECLDPTGFVSLREQALTPGLQDTYIDLYDVNVLNAFPGNPASNTTDNIRVFDVMINFPAAEDKAFSLGRIVDGTPAEIRQWVRDEQIIVHWEEITLAYEIVGQFPVRYLTSVPEPNSLALGGLALFGLHFAARRRPAR